VYRLAPAKIFGLRRIILPRPHHPAGNSESSYFFIWRADAGLEGNSLNLKQLSGPHTSFCSIPLNSSQPPIGTVRFRIVLLLLALTLYWGYI
jgi:hypothetical protein